MARSSFLGCLLLTVLALVSADFYSDVDIRYGSDKAKIMENGNLLQLSLDQNSGAGVQSKQTYLFGQFEIQMKVVPGNSAGTVTSFFLSSEVQERKYQDEIDFELLGNVTGQPYVVHTNVYTKGVGNREQQFNLWFDPRQDFHTYTVLWNPQQIVWYVDGTPIRVFKNAESMGVPYLKDQPLRIYCSLWNADDWATMGGRVKTDWSQAPFNAWYRYLKADACVASGGTTNCPSSKGNWWDQSLDTNATQKLNWARQNYMINDYCHDPNKYPQGFPPECSLSK